MAEIPKSAATGRPKRNVAQKARTLRTKNDPKTISARSSGLRAWSLIQCPCARQHAGQRPSAPMGERFASARGPALPFGLLNQSRSRTLPPVFLVLNRRVLGVHVAQQPFLPRKTDETLAAHPPDERQAHFLRDFHAPRGKA